jgi:polar amino acid transport system substrate-binding protein
MTGRKGRSMRTHPMHQCAAVLMLFVCTGIVLLWNSPVCSQEQPLEVLQNTTGLEPESIPEEIPTGIIINYDEDLAPLSYKADGEVKGILVEVLDTVLATRMGLQVEHRAYPRRRVPFLVKTGKSDAFCMSPGSRTKEYALIARSPVVVNSPALFTGVNNVRGEEIGTISRINDLRSFSQVDYLSSAWAKKTFPKDRLDDIHWVGSLDTALKMLAINRYDVYIGDEIVGRYTLMQIGLSEDIFVRPVSIGKRQQYHFGLRNTYPDATRIVADVERALNEADQDGTIRMIVEKYINPAFREE